jgi:hypothetical protein
LPKLGRHVAPAAERLAVDDDACGHWWSLRLVLRTGRSAVAAAL